MAKCMMEHTRLRAVISMEERIMNKFSCKTLSPGVLIGGAAQKSDFSRKVVGPSFLLICCSHEWELSPCKVGTKNFGALVTFGGSEVADFFSQCMQNIHVL